MALASDAAIRSFLSEAKTLKWSEKQNDCHYCDRYVNGTPQAIRPGRRAHRSRISINEAVIDS